VPAGAPFLTCALAVPFWPGIVQSTTDALSSIGISGTFWYPLTSWKWGPAMTRRIISGASGVWHIARAISAVGLALLMWKTAWAKNGKNLGQDNGDLADKLALLEYTALQEKMKYAVEDLHRVETFFPVAIGAFYVWLIKDGRAVASSERIILFVPVFIPIIGLFRHLARMRYIALLESYLRNVENANPKGLGWETFYEMNRHGSLQQYKRVRTGVWIALIIMTCFASYWLCGIRLS
jgi:hypothetical protein